MVIAHGTVPRCRLGLLALLLLGAAACGGAAATDEAQDVGVSSETTTLGVDQPATTSFEVDEPAPSVPADVDEPAPTSPATSAPPTTRVTTTTAATSPSGYEPPVPPVTGPLPTSPQARPTQPYLPRGPVDQVFPPGTKAYQLLADGDCGPLLRQIEQGEPRRGETERNPAWTGDVVPLETTFLYQAAANACLGRWEVATTQFGQIVLPLTCGFVGGEAAAGTVFASVAECQAVRMPVYRWTQALLAAHAADPAFVPNFDPPPRP
ncbi:MAG: hypothetical protein QOG43_1731 [Actinomycetota bacterium]|jgi:hypothetical protein|nr:hypothetical protein [Actinomycetota bacterium]